LGAAWSRWRRTGWCCGLAAIAALRETSIIFGAVLGRVFFGERFGPKRAVAASVVVFGIVLIAG